MVKIGNVELDIPVVAAPLAGISNPVYRKMCRSFGAALVVSEMISDKALHYNNKKTIDMCRTVKDEHPVSLQLFGGDPITMGEASKFLTENTDCDIIDINMGCPVNKVIKAHSGSYLMQYPDLAYDIMKAVVDNTDRPVTVKMRAGWDNAHINCVEIAKLAEKAGLSAIAIHGRCKSDMYQGSSNNEYIKRVKEVVSIPVIGNGDIKSVDDARRMMEETGCDAIMIGRGILGKPYFLQELKAYFSNEEFILPSYMERLDMLEKYIKELCEYEGERKGVSMMRGMCAWYIAGMPSANKYKNRLALSKSEEEMHEIIREYRNMMTE